MYKGEALAPIHIQYKDYTRWLRNKLKTGAIQRQGSYWLSRLSGELPVLTLPTDFPRPEVQGFEGNREEFLVTEKETTVLNAMAISEGVSMFMILLAVTYVLLGKISGQEDIIVGTPTAGRMHADVIFLQERRVLKAFLER